MKRLYIFKNPLVRKYTSVAIHAGLIALFTLSFQAALAQAPTTQASAITFTPVSGVSYTIGWTNGNGSKRIVIIDDAAIAFTPADNNTYSVNTDYTLGTDLGSGQKCVYNNNGNSVTVIGLTAGTTYFVRIYEYNGAAGAENYNTTTATGNPSSRATITASQPTTEATNFVFSAVGTTTITVNFTNGNGASRILVGKSGAAAALTLTDGITYPVAADFSGPDIGNGYRALGLGSGSFVITGLTGDQTYDFKVFEFNGAAGTGAENYKTGSPLTGDQQTEPTTQASALNFTGLGTTGLTLNWTNGNGDRRVVLIHSGAAVDADPADFTNYTVSSNWNSGATTATQIGTGNYIVFDGTGTSVAMTNLIANTVYHFAVYEYNGANLSSAVYMTPGATASRTSLAAVPTTDATAFVFSSVTANSMSVNFTNGNGASRILVGKSGAAVAFTPTNGTTYSAAADFSGPDVGGGYRVLGIGSGAFAITGLTGDQAYNFKVFEFNGSGGAENYKSGSPLSGNQQTEPTTQASALNFTGLGTTGLTLNWTNGNGDRRVVLIHSGAAVDADPADFTNYTVSSNWNSGATTATQIGTGNYIVFDGTGTSVAMTNLIANTVYHFAVYEYNGANLSSAVYMTPGATASQTSLAAVPTTDATAFVFSSVTANSMSVNFTNGNGASRILVGKSGAAVAFTPTNGTTYSAAADFSGPDVGGGYRVLGIGSGAFAITGLTGDQAYNFKVFEFNGSGGAENYKSGSPLSGNQQTEPTTQASALNFSAFSTTGLTLNWTNGNGDRRVVLIHSGAPVDADPADFTNYTVSSNWNSGATTATQIGTGNYIVFDGTGTSVAMTNLIANTVYHFAVYEYNGANLSSAVYMTPGATANRTTLANAPTTDATSFVFSNVTATTMTVNFTNGNGASRILVGKSGAAAALTPANGTTYTAAADFSGIDIGNGYRVLGIGSGAFNISGMTGDQTYNFKVFEFNGSGGAENYRTGGGVLSGNQQTEPTTQASALNFTAISNTSITLNWTNGNGDRRVVLIHEGAPVDADPVDFTNYTVSSNWNNGSTTATQIGTGNYIVYNNTGSNVAMTNLIPNTVYHFAVYEYNGAGLTTAVYMTPGATANQTTLATEPTTQASSIGFASTQTSTTLTWTNGNGATRLVLGHYNAAVDANPADGVGTYTADPILGNGTQIGTGNFVVYIGTGNSVMVTGLSSGEQYYFRVYEFNGTGASSNYLTSTNPNNPNNVTLPSAAFTTISAGAGVEPASFSSLINTQGAAVLNFDFTVLDDGGTPAADNSSTRISALTINRKDLVSGDIDDWSQAILGAEFSGPADTGPTTVTASSITANQIVFTGIPFAFSSGNYELGRIPDNSSKTYTIKIWLKTALGGTLPDDIDGKVVVMRIAETDFALGSGSSGFVGGQSVESGDTKNAVGVVATKININQQPSTTAFALVPLTVQPIFEARDANDNRDVDFAQAITVVTGAPSNLGPASAPANFAAGLADFTASGFNFTAVGNSTMKVTTPSITAGNSEASSLITVSGSNESNIIPSPAFIPPTNIDYTLFQRSTSLVGALAGVIKVGEFVIQDGGNDLIDADGLSTTLTDLVMSINSPGNNIRRVGIHDGVSIIADAVPVAGSVTFSGLSITATDGIGAQRIFSVYVSFNAPVVDNEHFELQITSVTAANTGSVFAFSDGLAGSGGSSTSTAPSDNKVVVTATQAKFSVQPTNTEILVTTAPSPAVEAVDALLSRDLDFSGPAFLSSNGSMTTAPTANLVAGVGTFSPVIHDTKALNRQITATVPGLPIFSQNVTSNTFNITASAISDIVATGTPPSNILYKDYQAADITGGANDIAVATFRIRDGGVGLNDTDLGPTLLNNITFAVTNPQLLRRVALYDGGVELAEMPGGTASVTFSNLNGGLGYGPNDATTRDFTVRVSFNNTAATITDNLQFSFAITNATTTVKSSDFAAANAGGAVSGTAVDQNRIEVVASNFQFTTQPSASVFVNIPFASPVVLEARDINSIKDLDYVTAVNVSNAGSIPMTDAAGHSSVTTFSVPFVAGVLALNNQLRYDIKGSGNGTLTVAEPGPGITVTSIPVSVVVSSTSDIVTTPAFVYPTNIDYIPLQTNNINPASAGDEIQVASFDLRDGGVSAPDLDGTGTELTSLTLTITNSSFIKRLALYNGATELSEVAVSGSSVTFGPFSATATDNGTLTLALWASFNTTITDKQQISFTVTNTATNPDRSVMAAPNAGGAATSVAGNNNRMDVIATKLDYTSIAPGGVTVYISADFSVTVEARDVNANLDLDFAGTVSSITNAGTLATNPSPATSGVFTAGIKNFTFKYLTAGSGTLTMSTTGPAINTQVSPTITVQAASESRVYLTGPYSTRIDYINHEEASNPSTFVLARLTLTDGDADGTPGDVDAAPTVLNQLQISLTNSSFIKRIGVYDDTNTLIPGTEQNGGASLTFSSLGITAPDDGSKTFTIRASFDFNNVVDEQNIQLVITGATQGVGSNFLTGAGLIGGSNLANRTSPSTGANIMDVVATQTVFIQSPPSTVGTLQPVPIAPATQVEVRALDAHGKLDTEVDASLVGSAMSQVQFDLPGAGPSSLQQTNHDFTLGIAVIPRDNLQYSGEGNGTLRANLVNPPPTVAAVTPGISSPVDVFEVQAIYSFGGVITPVNLASGSVDKVIYGVTFKTGYATSSNGPELSKFKISFDFLGSDIRSVIKASTVRVYEQIDNQIFSGGTLVTDPTINGVVSINSTQITVDLSATPRPFYVSAGVTHTYSYFLKVDIEGTANSSTPPMTPYIEDLNYDNSGHVFDPTNTNIVVDPLTAANQGGGRADKLTTKGQTYRFAAIFPPKLISSTPATGSLNADPNGNVTLHFDVPVYTVDKKVYLWSTTGAGVPGTLIDSLDLIGPLVSPSYTGAPPPNFPLDTAHVSNDLTFGPLPGLPYNSLFYITVKAVTDDGASPPNLLTGVLDKPGNKFAGVSSPSTVYFRTASNQAPLLLTGPVPSVPKATSIINISTTGAIIEATFDKKGTAFYVLTNAGAPAPSRAEILGPGKTRGGIVGVAYASALTRDSIAIKQVQPNTQYGLINYPLVNGNSYKVWMFAINDDLPANIATSGPYGSPPSPPASGNPGQFPVVADGTNSPTFTFTASAQLALIQPTTVLVCPGVYQPMNTPIRIVETNVNDFNGTGSGTQSFNLILPPGFVFDVTRPGTVTLSNTSDFAPGSGTSSFLSSSVVTISFSNSAAMGHPGSTLDNITISGFYVLSTGAASGPIKKLGGLATISELAVVANIQTTNVNPANFINSAVGDVAFMPDSIATPGHPPFLVQLIPQLSAGDYGPSTFSGSGVNGDILFLKSVTLSQPFLVTMSHADNNGCVADVSNQYLVYDHKTGLGIKTQYCITEKYFPVQPPLPGSYPTKYTVRYDAFPGFYLRNVVTKDVVGTLPTFLNDPTPSGTAGYLAPSAAAKTLPNAVSPNFDPANNPVPGQVYNNWNFYVTHIDSTDWPTYTRYRFKSPRNNEYFTGGTLGSVEFKGFYQSIANAPLDSIPLTQNTEFYAPPLLIIEVSDADGLSVKRTKLDITDPALGTLPPNDPVTNVPRGTYLFCQKGGTITFNGWPAASATADGVFALFNHITGAPITGLSLADFQDFKNGTATLNPDSPTLLGQLVGVGGGYQHIRVVYTYKEKNSPCESTTFIVIRITPNPIPSYTTSTRCEDIPITFTSTSTIAGAPGQFTISKYRWLFADPNSSPANNIDTTSNTGTSTHIYPVPGDWPNVSLGVASNFGCLSTADYVDTLKVGGTPVVNYEFTGVALKDSIRFTATGSSVSANDKFDSLIWTFGPGRIKKKVYTNQADYVTKATAYRYDTAQKYVTDLRIVSKNGCVSRRSDAFPSPEFRTIVVLPNRYASYLKAYEEYFDSDTVGGGWQSWYASNASNPLTATSPVPSWRHNPVDRSVINLGTGSGKYWATSNNNTTSATYNPKERSALYSPAFRLDSLYAPMISFSSIVNMQPSDGVIVEYSQDNKNIVDPTKVWIRLGKNIGEGVDWFTDKGIAAKPGDQTGNIYGNDFGWTGTAKNVWIAPKHTIDTIGTTGGLINVVFRFALASASDSPFEGFALDSVRIGDRTRTILLESFTNVGNDNSDEKAMNDSVRVFPRSIVGTKVVKINYHLNFPKDDPFNLANPQDPSSRASFYGIEKTPKSRLDGSNDPSGLDRKFSSWGYPTYGKRSLQLAQADLKIFPTQIAGGISIGIRAKAIFTLPANTVLHVAVLEDTVFSTSPDLSNSEKSMILSGEPIFTNVLKKMLPSASGRKLGTPLLEGDSIDFPPVQYIPEKLYSDAVNDLTIVAFLQREDGDHEIFQVSLADTISDPPLITGLEPIASEKVLVYPNPANHELTVQMPGVLTRSAAIHMIDQTGRTTLQSAIPEGSDRQTINVSDLTTGVYILTIDMGQGVLTRKKVVVVH